jgi:hypothetical protein
MKKHIDVQNHTHAELESYSETEKLFSQSSDSLSDKIDCFARFASRKSLARFLVRYELFKKILDIHGSVIDCGVLSGQGLFTFAKISTMLEPYNHTRRVIGFDTFEGFPDIDEKDDSTGTSSLLKKGLLKSDNYENLQKSVEIFDMHRPLSHIEKIQLVKGDICDTAPNFLDENPHLIVSLLYLDVDLHRPTMAALKAFAPLVPKGGIIAFDELNLKDFPGETQAFKEYFNVNSVTLHRSPIDPGISYIQL